MVDQNSFLIQLSETLCPLVSDAPLTALSGAEQVFVCVYEIEREVNNGGFEQFYQNSFGRYALDSETALRTIGAMDMAMIVHEANRAVFPAGSIPENKDMRTDVLEASGSVVADRLSELDDRFCQYPDNLTKLLYDYVLENRQSIRGL